ncbi:MAG: hypothetical protein K6E83_07690 [Clostridium sp.]|nr:hypothetical protein [Clostridium sp.]
MSIVKSMLKQKPGHAALLFCIILSIFLTACGGGAKDISGTDVDVDLTKLGGNILYGQVYSMVNEPRDYLGKSVRMQGFFTPYDEYDKKGNIVETRMSCFVPDAQGCCSQGIEFVLDGDYTYPQDYPEVGTPITVEGTFETYQVYGLNRVQLLGASMKVGK